MFYTLYKIYYFILKYSLEVLICTGPEFIHETYFKSFIVRDYIICSTTIALAMKTDTEKMKPNL